MDAQVVKQIERLALRDPLESDAAEFPRDYYEKHVRRAVEDARKWVAAREHGSNAYDSDPKVIAEIRAQLIRNGASTEFMESHAWWGRLEKLLENPGVAEVMYQGGIKSRFLAPLLIAMPSSLALEPAFLHGMTIDLKYDKITPEDAYYETARREDLFKYIRIRSAFSGDMLNLLQPGKSVFYNCGRMFATRFISPLDGAQLGICIDIDPSVKADTLFPHIYDRHHYAFFNAPNEEMIYNEVSYNADYAESLGRIVYTFTMEDYTAAREFLTRAVANLNSGGVMVFDLNCAHRDWEKLLLPMAWARGKVTMTLLKDNETIKSFVKEELLKDAPLDALIAKDIVIHNQDVGVVFAAVRK
ncbi:hypothetical protein IJ114_00885 [Candidatus Saccharibacteria bacterium]|nr:hypothetical protein [Candidatus Saccharibacteria bacterium]